MIAAKNADSKLKKRFNEIAKLLINAKADLNAISEDGSTALSEAVCKNNHELVELLVKRNANIMNTDMKYRDSSAFFKAIAL